MSIESEERLVEAAQNGHLQSFAILYERYYRAMVAVAYSVIADHALAEDAAQETFAIACRDLPLLRRSNRFPGWLAGICRNVARQMRRVPKRAAQPNEPPPAEGRPDDYRDAVRQAVWKLRPLLR
ncbi:MAG: RNA polymerase sigma factor [Planctomycetota bacterium]